MPQVKEAGSLGRDGGQGLGGAGVAALCIGQCVVCGVLFEPRCGVLRLDWLDWAVWLCVGVVVCRCDGALWWCGGVVVWYGIPTPLT